MEHESSATKKPIRCIVKLGGAAITCKNELEQITEENLEIVSSQLRLALMPESSSHKVLGMDCSKRHGITDIPCLWNMILAIIWRPTPPNLWFMELVLLGTFKPASLVFIKREYPPSECPHFHVDGQLAVERLETFIDFIFSLYDGI